MIRILVVSALLTMAIAGTKNSNPTQYSRRGGGGGCGPRCSRVHHHFAWLYVGILKNKVLGACYSLVLVGITTSDG